MRAKKLMAGILSAAMSFSILSVLPFAPVSAETLIGNDFERNYDGWTNLGETAALTAAADAAYDSARGMRVTGRQTAADGAFSEKGFYIEGGYEYEYSVSVRAASAEHFRLTLSWDNADGTTGEALIAEADAKAGEWKKIACKYEAPVGAYHLTLKLTTDSTADFDFDDFYVTGQTPYHSEAEIRAYAADAGLKDMYANYFRIGTCMPNSALNNSTITGIILRDFNSVTCENELKPDATIVTNGSSDDNIKVSLSRAAGIIDFCVNNNIAMRGHTFVWHSQTPTEFFKQGFQKNNNWVDKSTMNKRMESYIKNMFDALAEQYPDLNLYAYDVCNECIADGNSGGPRQAGDNNTNQGTSAWVSVYGDNSFIKQAFTYAKKYRPDGCKLFYNDYNEYESAKMNGIVKVLQELKAENLIDGMGMQSHITPQYTSSQQYIAAMKNYAEVLGCVHITELDIAGADANYYKAIMQAAMETPEVEAFVVWGTTDNTSWRSGNSPLLFDGSGNKKEAYNALASLVPESEWGDGNNPVGGGKTPTVYEPDENGCYFFCDFEDGEQRWDVRGSSKVAQTNNEAYEGSGSLSVTGRQDTWNGTARSLSSNPFKPGETFSFGAAVKYTSGEATEQIKLTLQYSADGDTHYDEVATVTAKKGEWTLISNDAFTIPTGATGMLLYLETPDEGGSLIDFYVDNAYGGIEGAHPVKLAAENPAETTTTTTTTEPDPQKEALAGDVDESGDVNVADAVLLARFLAEDADVTVSTQGKLNANVDGKTGVTADDLTKIMEYLAGMVSAL